MQNEILPSIQPFGFSVLLCNFRRSLPDRIYHSQIHTTTIMTSIIDQCYCQSLKTFPINFNKKLLRPYDKNYFVFVSRNLLFSIGRESRLFINAICSDLKIFGNRYFSRLMTRLLQRFVATSMFLK